MIKNLTPHAVHVHLENGDIVTFPSQGIARAKQSMETVGSLEGIKLVRMTYGEPVDLPDYQEGEWLIVSLLTANAARAAGRRVDDLLLTADLVRDANGIITGCRALCPVGA